MKICVIGLGYVGLPTAILFADSGQEVVGVDINESLIHNINHGQQQVEDEQINSIFRKVIETGALFASTSISEANIYVVAVPTPVRDKKIDLKHVLSACQTITPVLKKGDLVIIESTISPGTTEGPIKHELEQTGLVAGEDFHLAHIPERVQPGNMYHELIYNDRVVGGLNHHSSRKAIDLYKSFVKGEFIETDAKTAETTKVIENTFRDVNIAFANEIMVICEQIGVNPWDAIHIANRHPRVNILKPGPGVGGHCIPVDPWFLIEQHSEESLLLQSARSRNDKMPTKVTQDIVTILKRIHGSKVSLLGCTYKADSSDDRETPTEKIVDNLTSIGVNFSAYDPYLLKQWNCTTTSLDECIMDTDLIAIIVPHMEFRQLNPEALRSRTKCRTIFDCTNSCDTQLWNHAGFEVIKLGRVVKYGRT